ncbi:hypothetical protein [Vibrio sp. 10N.261.51.F12]|uniref:hypothetical protein n=1 Tax=Vibrio sp. 10N.261.51.F12 TaxID=3229679 RepID=UPI00354AD735
MNLPNLTLKHWMGKGELYKLGNALLGYWSRIKAILEWPLQQLDPMVAPIEFVDLIAWQRDIERLPKEPEQIYRIRVNFAYSFAAGGGSEVGWEDMFAKLGYPHIKIDERLNYYPWDIVSVKVKDGDINDVPGLMDAIVRQYGRTCRRYSFDVTSTANFHVSVAEFSHTHETYSASIG